MTNSEKAREYAAEKFKVNPESKKWNITTTYMSACEWKDQQFKKYLEKKKVDLASRRAEVGINIYVGQNLLDEIINELFKED